VLITLPSYKKTCEKRQIKPAKKNGLKRRQKYFDDKTKKTITKEEVGLKNRTLYTLTILTKTYN